MNKLISVTAALLLSISCATLIAAEEDEESKASATSSEEIASSCDKQYSAEAYPNDEERMTLIDQCINENTELAQQSRE